MDRLIGSDGQFVQRSRYEVATALKSGAFLPITPAMRLGHSPPYTDPADVRFRVATVKTGCWLTFAICGAIVLYLAQTWGAGNREVLLAFVLGSVTFSVIALAMLPLERIVWGRWRETFFMCWSFAMVAVIVIGRALDPLPQSPITLVLFLPLLFAGISYPVPSATTVAEGTG